MRLWAVANGWHCNWTAAYIAYIYCTQPTLPHCKLWPHSAIITSVSSFAAFVATRRLDAPLAIRQHAMATKAANSNSNNNKRDQRNSFTTLCALRIRRVCRCTALRCQLFPSCCTLSGSLGSCLAMQLHCCCCWAAVVVVVVLVVVVDMVCWLSYNRQIYWTI